jgi:hypothetical protein
LEETITSKTKGASCRIQIRNIPLVAIVILALITPLVCSGALIAENISSDLEDDIEFVVSDPITPAGDTGEDFRSERLKANLLIYGIFGIIFVGAYISVRPLQHVKINSVATSCNM